MEYSDPFDIARDIHHVLADMRDKKWVSFDRKKAAEEFSDSLARLWKIHPFREGNTRTTITFMCQYAEEVGIAPETMYADSYPYTAQSVSVVVG